MICSSRLASNVHPITNPAPLSCSVQRNRSYTTLQEEALKVFSSLQHLEGVADPVPIIQGILQTGQELKPLRDELFCQLIKQTMRPPQPGSPGNLCSWKILACMSCTFIPTRSILRYLKFHLKRYGMFTEGNTDSEQHGLGDETTLFL